MVELERNSSTSPYVPHYLAISLEDIDFRQLADCGVKYLVFDADSTLVPYRGVEISQTTQAFLGGQRKLFKGWCIASNRVINDLGPMAESMGMHVIRARGLVRKPQRRFFKRVTDYFYDAKPHEIAMIGDKLRTDVYGGNRAGFVTVWVEHLGKDGMLDHIFFVRQLEKWYLRRCSGKYRESKITQN